MDSKKGFKILPNFSDFAQRCAALAALAALFAAGSAVAAGDIEKGSVLAETCKGCHAVDTYNNVYPTYHVPRIGGQSAEYLAAALTLYRNGDRPHATMQAQAAAYSDEDIQDIAAYLAAVAPPVTTKEPVGSAPESAQVCASCHGATGIGEIASYPYLAGQHEDYLKHALELYKGGKRKGVNATVMQAQLMSLTDDDIRAIARFYSKQQGLTTLPMD